MSRPCTGQVQPLVRGKCNVLPSFLTLQSMEVRSRVTLPFPNTSFCVDIIPFLVSKMGLMMWAPIHQGPCELTK